jgi:formylglycine-generating enzyme required for sulfatase activity
MELAGTTAVLATGFAIGGVFLGVAWKADDGVSKQLKEDLSLWLLCVESDKVGQSIQRWPTHFAALFDRIFGDRHLSWRCFFRSCMASVLAVVLCTLIFAQVAPGVWAAFSPGLGLLERFTSIGVLALLLNLLPDYISLLETRFIIRNLQTARSFLSQVAWLLADFMVTFCIFTLAFVAIFFVWLGDLLGDKDIIDTLRLATGAGVLDASVPVYGRPLAIFLWTTFLTSVWVWLYFFAQFLMRLTEPIRKSIDFLQYALPVDERPLRAVGEVIALIACLGYWSVMLPQVALRGDNYIEPEMAVVPAGSFCMGDNQGEGYGTEKPVHTVHISKFAIGKYEVSFDEYDIFAQATGRVKPPDYYWRRSNRPVIDVSWDDAIAYTKWLSEQTGKRYRLPTEAEWEYAARAGTETRYWWGDDIQQHGKVWANCDGCGSQWDNDQTAPVGSFDANPFGLYDTAGNVSEWVQDCWHDSYKGAPTDGSAWLKQDGGDCARRVVRGGSWFDKPRGVRSAGRGRLGPAHGPNDTGFRLAQDL